MKPETIRHLIAATKAGRIDWSDTSLEVYLGQLGPFAIKLVDPVHYRYVVTAANANGVPPTQVGSFESQDLFSAMHRSIMDRRLKFGDWFADLAAKAAPREAHRCECPRPANCHRCER